MSFDATLDIAEDSAEDQAKGRWFVGTVVDINDPDGLGRVKASVPNLYDPNAGEIPWIGPLKQSPFGQGPNFGVYGSPQLGAKVTVVLQEGKAQYPAFIGGILTAADVNALFKNPKTWGFQDPTGNRVLVDMEAGTWQFTHGPSGDSVKFDANGAITVIAYSNVKVYSNARIDLQAPLTTLNSIQPVN